MALFAESMVFLIIVAFISTRKLALIPSKIQAFCESLMGFFWGLTDSMIGQGGRKHIPLVASLFLFIVTANLVTHLDANVSLIMKNAPHIQV
jgi:F-type H+-transporting ATPase subunit a